MISGRYKKWLFVVEALGSLACGFYGEYFYFMLRDRYGFTNLGNLSVSAMQGLIFAAAAWLGGKYAQRYSYLKGVKTGLLVMAVALVMGGMFSSLSIQLLVFVMWTTGMCFVSPAQEALISHGESADTLPRIVGVFNVVWASCSAFSYFFGGMLFEYLGKDSIYWLPVGVFCFQFCLLAILEKRSVVTDQERTTTPRIAKLMQPETTLNNSRVPKSFVRMAWLANPFACIGINSMLAMIPSLAQSHQLSTPAAGAFCSVWFFGRLVSFIVLAHWNGWHYRFGWLLGAFVGLIAGFSAILTTPNLWLLLMAQVVFGLSVGLIYYSSLFYSMDVNDRKAEHGGVHEAAMGAGNCIGPAVGAASLILAPQTANVSAYAVSLLLTGGLVSLIYLRLRGLFRRDDI